MSSKSSGSLVLYSLCVDRDNEEIDIRMRDLLGDDPQVTYIPSQYYESEILFREFVRHFSRYGINRFLLFPVDIPHDAHLISRAFDSDLIYLAGGNTFYFLESLRKSKMLDRLRQFHAQGGIVAGASAGAILTTPNIATAGFPEFDRDENEEGITQLKSLGLVNFEFFPHYRNSKRYEQEMQKYSKKSPRTLYAVPDSSGIIVEPNSVSFCGKVYGFARGRRILIKS